MVLKCGQSTHLIQLLLVLSLSTRLIARFRHLAIDLVRKVVPNAERDRGSGSWKEDQAEKEKKEAEEE